MDPRVSWASFDAGDYKGAAEGFAKPDCGSPEKGKYLFLGGIAWMKAGLKENARAFFSAVFHRGEEKEPVSGVELAPLAYSYFARLAADSGDLEAIDEMERYYGNSFPNARIVWIDEAMKPLGTTSLDAASRDLRALQADARLEDYGLYQKARALAVRGSFDELRAIAPASLDAVAGTHLEDGEVRDLRKSLGRVLEDPDAVRESLAGSSPSKSLWLLVLGGAAAVFVVSRRGGRRL